MADFEQAGASERLRRLAILREMQAKLKRSHAEALGISVGAAPSEVRSAFMALTKQYHPAKFARLDEATVKLANEVFLQLREAYEQLATAGNKRARTMPGLGGSHGSGGASGSSGASDHEPTRKPELQAPAATAATGQGVRVSDRAGTAAGLGGTVRVPDRSAAIPGPHASPAATPATPAANTNNAGARRPLVGGHRIGATAPAAASPGATAPTRPSAPSLSPSMSSSVPPSMSPSVPPSMSPSVAARPGGTGTSPSASTSSGSASAPAPAGPPTRPSAPSISASASTSMGARPAAVPAAGSGKVVSSSPLSSSASSSGSSSGSSPGSSAASSSATAGGPKIRFGAPAPAAASAPQAAAPSNNNAELARIRGLISRQKWTEARDALQLLLQRAPTDRGSMAQLAYVRGREALELGNVSEARRELLRALAIEPAMEAARVTLRELNDVSPSSNPSAPRR